MQNHHHDRRENGERRPGREMSIAVAVDKDKNSQSALKWAIDNIVTRNHVLKLVHVKPAASSSHPTPAAVPNEEQLMFLPLRCYCRRRRVECETVLLDDTDVARALIVYVFLSGIDTLVLGSGTRNGLAKLFKPADVPGNVFKWAPEFCSVYIVSKGKLGGLRNASRPIPANISAAGAALLAQRNLIAESAPAMGAESLYDELSPPDPPCTPHGSASDSPSTDAAYFAFYENLGQSGVTQNLPRDLNVEEKDFELRSRSPIALNRVSELEFESFDSAATPWLEQINEVDQEDEMKRIRTELKKTIEMYHAACKEALTATRKAKKFEQRKIREEKRLHKAQLAEETAMQMLEREKAKCKAANEAAKAVQNRVEIEVQKRVKAEKKALREAEEKQKVLEALGKSHRFFTYQSLFHMIAVSILFCIYYFSVFK